MTSLLLQRGHLKSFYDRYSYAIQPMIRLLFALCVFLSLNANIGYMNKLKNPLVVILVCLVNALLPYRAIVFLAGCLLAAHVCAVSLEMALITLVLILTIAILYYGFKLGDSYLIVLTPLAFLFKIPYAVPLLMGSGGNLASVIPVGCGVFLYYLIMYMKQNADVLTNDAAVDTVQKYSQILKSVTFNQTMMVVIITCTVGIITMHLIRRLSMDYSWVVAIAAGSAAELLMIFVGGFVFGVIITMGQLILDVLLSTVIAAVYNFFIFTVDYTRMERARFEDDDYYCYIEVVPKMNVGIPDVKVQKIGARKRNTRERNVY